VKQVCFCGKTLKLSLDFEGCDKYSTKSLPGAIVFFPSETACVVPVSSSLLRPALLFRRLKLPSLFAPALGRIAAVFVVGDARGTVAVPFAVHPFAGAVRRSAFLHSFFSLMSRFFLQSSTSETKNRRESSGSGMICNIFPFFG
jgi:hypothetical protein